VPKIEAATVAEHRRMVKARLVDAAEQLMRIGQPLTAAAVASSAGIARNSIYRYVISVDELRDLVVARYLPGWMDTVAAELDATDGPADRISTWVGANLREAADSGHGWLMASVRPVPVAAVSDGAVDRAHSGMRKALYEAWLELTDDPERARIGTALTAAILEAGFRQLDTDLSPHAVIESATKGTSALVAALR
jgi:AcrR family transcriptional regulator